MTGLREVETSLARCTLSALVVYFPLETWASWSDGLTDPFYLVDLIAMALLLWGAVHSLRARPNAAPGVLCGAFGWTAANGWRATFGRIQEISQGGTLDHGAAELWLVSIGTGLALLLFGLSLYLVVQITRRG